MCLRGKVQVWGDDSRVDLWVRPAWAEDDDLQGELAEWICRNWDEPATSHGWRELQTFYRLVFD